MIGTERVGGVGPLDAPRRQPGRPPTSGGRIHSVLAGSALQRAAVVAVGLAVLWLAVLWAVAAP